MKIGGREKWTIFSLSVKKYSIINVNVQLEPVPQLGSGLNIEL